MFDLQEDDDKTGPKEEPTVDDVEVDEDDDEFEDDDDEDYEPDTTEV